MNRELAAAARALADSTSASLSEVQGARRVVLTIVTVSPVTVLWRGVAVPPAGVNRLYTPVVGHRVVCDLIDNQLFVDYSPA